LIGQADYPTRFAERTLTLSIPDHEDHESASAERHAAAQRSTWVSVAVNLLLTAMQAAAGVLTGSQALVADSLHSLSDLASDFVVLLANRHSRKGPDEDHPYGHHRFETAASLVLGLILLAVGGGLMWAAIGKLRAPEAIPPVGMAALWVALLALAAKESLFRYMLHVAHRVRSSLLVANAWHARSDAASSLVVAAGIAGNLAGLPLLDPIAALVVGGMVARMGWQFGWEALHDLMDRSADAAVAREVERILRDTPGVLGLHDLRTRKMADWVTVDVHLEIDRTMTVEQGHDIAVSARQRVMAALPVLNVMTHVDPVDAPVVQPDPLS
jgi:cation diffusion facilitator family transporter